MPLDEKTSSAISYAARLRISVLSAAFVWALSFPAEGDCRGFAATGNITQGNAQITTSANETQIAVRSPQAVIDWTLDSGSPEVPTNPDAPFAFLAEGASAIYTGVDGAADGYTVLNRLLFPKQSGFDGTVKSFVGTSAGGNIWFYSPNGIIVGDHASFSVGSLVLTSNDIDATGGLLGADGAIRFRGAASSLASVLVRPGANVVAEGDSQSYLAVVAPKVVQDGTLSSTGSVALVAAEQANIRINAGILDIAIIQGTTERNGLVHTGTTGGPVTAGRQAVFMVAVPKSEALFMLLGGTIGYRPATQASTDGTSVILLAGDSDSLGRASIRIGDFGNTVFSSPVSAIATTAIDVAPAIGSRVDFGSGATLFAGREVQLAAVRRSQINVGGNLRLRSGTIGDGGMVSVSARGSAQNMANAGRITAGSLDIDVSGVADDADGNGGSALLDASGGMIAVGRLAVDASGTGNRGSGGDIVLAVGGSGAIETSQTNLRARGLGRASGSVGGDGFGGSVTLRSAGGRLALADTAIDVDASSGLTGLDNGTAAAGKVLIDLDNSQQNWGGLAITANALAGPNGARQAGEITTRIASSGQLQIGGDLGVRAIGAIDQGKTNFRLQAAEAALVVDGSATIDVSNSVDLALGTGGVMEVGGAFSVAAGSRMTSSGAISAGNVSLHADEGIALAELRSSGPTLLEAMRGEIAISRDLISQGAIAAAAEALQISSTGSLDFSGASASLGDLSISVAEDLTVSSGSSAGRLSLNAGGDIRAETGMRATGEFTVDAGGTLLLSGPMVGENISIRSRDIDLSGNGRIGERGKTASLRVEIAPAAANATIGGSGDNGQAGAFSLDADEVTNLFADEAIVIQRASAGPAGSTLTLDDFSMRYGPSGNIGTGGELRVVTPADLAIVGNVDLATESANDSIALSAKTITIDPASARIVMAGENASLLGRADLQADTIIAATPDVRALIAGGAAPTVVSTALGRPMAGGTGDGYLRAGAIALDFRDGLFLQNSGLSIQTAARRGFAAQSLSITTRNVNALVAINGTTISAAGAAVVGRDTAQTLSINGSPGSEARGVNPASTVNGCVLGGDCTVGGSDGGPSPGLPLPSLPRSAFFDAIDISRLTDSTRLPRAPEALSERNDVSRLAQNDAFRGDGTALESPLRDIASLGDSGAREADGDPSPNEALPIWDENSLIDAVMRAQLLANLVVTEQADPYLQNPLIDEPSTGVGNDDLWLNICQPSEDGKCVAAAPAEEGK